MASNSNSAEQIQKELDPAAPTASPSAKDQIKPNQSKPRRNNRRGGGGQSRDVLVSKALSKLLRHDAEKHKLKLDEHGFARVDEVLNVPVIKSMKVTFPEIQHAVSDNAKQRFAMKAAPDAPTPPSDTDPSQYLIRANQGHSIASVASENLLKPLTLDTLPPTIVHGSYYALYPLILESGGLKAMSRNQIHFSIGLPEDRESNVISGMRNDAELLFYVDAAKAMRDDVKWWISDNGVVLSEGDAEGCIGPKYWKKVEGRKGGVGVLWEEGVEVAKIPEGVRGKKVPVGKARGEKK